MSQTSDQAENSLDLDLLTAAHILTASYSLLNMKGLVDFGYAWDRRTRPDFFDYKMYPQPPQIKVVYDKLKADSADKKQRFQIGADGKDPTERFAAFDWHVRLMQWNQNLAGIARISEKSPYKSEQVKEKLGLMRWIAHTIGCLIENTDTDPATRDIVKSDLERVFHDPITTPKDTFFNRIKMRRHTDMQLIRSLEITSTMEQEQSTSNIAHILKEHNL